MALPTGYHIQMVVTDADGNLVKMLPVSVASDVKIDPSGNERIESTIENLQQLINSLGKMAFVDQVPAGSIDTAGLVKLSNVIDDKTAQSTAATTAAVSQVAEVAENAVQKTGDEDIGGTKNFSDGISINGDTSITSATDTEGNTTVTVSFPTA